MEIKLKVVNTYVCGWGGRAGRHFFPLGTRVGHGPSHRLPLHLLCSCAACSCMHVLGRGVVFAQCCYRACEVLAPGVWREWLLG